MGKKERFQNKNKRYWILKRHSLWKKKKKNKKKQKKKTKNENASKYQSTLFAILLVM